MLGGGGSEGLRGLKVEGEEREEGAGLGVGKGSVGGEVDEFFCRRREVLMKVCGAREGSPVGGIP